MNKRAVRGIVFFVVFFCLGLGIYTAFNSLLAPSKPMAGEEDIAVSGAISEVAAKVSPSVVGITNLRGDGDLFNQRTTESTGSGVILDNQGYIVTNNHVVRGADQLIVTLADGNEEEARIIGTDPRTDLALIKVKVDNYVTPIKFGDSDRLAVGDEVVAIGNPLGLRFARSVTAGVVSGLNRLLTTEEGFAFRLIQTDAAINPGNSGGALVNLEGSLIGINTIKIAAEGFEGMGFAIPSNQVQTVLSDIKKYGRVVRPILGIRTLCEFSRNETKYFNIPAASGIAVEPINGGPAHQAGIRKYDIITKIDNKEVSTALDLQEKISNKKIGQQVEIQLIRLPEDQGGSAEFKTMKIKLDKQ